MTKTQTLLLRLAGPSQSWGGAGAVNRTRPTQMFPTKSGVLGLLCAALGRKRHEPVSDLAQLKMAVRIDQPGRLMRDFQVAQNVARSQGGRPKPTQPVYKWYVWDAVFIVSLTGRVELIETLAAALKTPVWTLWLGRKNCPPTAPLLLGVFDEGLEDDILATYPYQGHQEQTTLVGIVETDDQDADIWVRDVPISFSPPSYGVRGLRYVSWPTPVSA